MSSKSRQRPVRLSPRQRRLRYLARRALWTAGVALALAGLVVADRLGAFGRAAQPDWERYHDRTFKVVRVIDGDTLEIDSPDRRGGFGTTRIRLWGVDTPETVKPDTPVQHFGQEATRFLRHAVLGKIVTVKLYRPRTRDAYDRLLAYVIGPDGKDLNERIIGTGHGYADPRFPHPLRTRYRMCQSEAMKARAGLWKEAVDDDLPYYYRGKLRLPAGPPATFPQ